MGKQKQQKTDPRLTPLPGFDPGLPGRNAFPNFMPLPPGTGPTIPPVANLGNGLSGLNAMPSMPNVTPVQSDALPKLKNLWDQFPAYPDLTKPQAPIGPGSPYGLLQGANTAYGAAQVTPYAEELARAQAAGAGANAGLGGISQVDPNALRYHPPTYTPQNYSPQELPPHALPQIPDRPAPQNDMASGLLSGIAGLLDPGAAGHYAAAPLQAAHSYAAQAYDDALRRYQMALQQSNVQYGDAAAQVGQNNQAQLYNVGNANSAQQFNQGNAVAGNIRQGVDESAVERARLPFLQAGASAQSLQGSLPGLDARQSGANAARAGVENAQIGVQAPTAQYNLQRQNIEDQLRLGTGVMNAESLLDQRNNQAALNSFTAQTNRYNMIGRLEQQAKHDALMKELRGLKYGPDGKPIMSLSQSLSIQARFAELGIPLPAELAGGYHIPGLTEGLAGQKFAKMDAVQKAARVKFNQAELNHLMSQEQSLYAQLNIAVDEALKAEYRTKLKENQDRQAELKGELNELTKPPAANVPGGGTVGGPGREIAPGVSFAPINPAPAPAAPTSPNTPGKSNATMGGSAPGKK